MFTGLIYFTLGFISAYVLSIAVHHFALTRYLTDLQTKYERLINVISEWQKNI